MCTMILCIRHWRFEERRLVEIHLVSGTSNVYVGVSVFEDDTGYLGRLRRLGESVRSKFLGLGPVVIFNVYAIKAEETSRTRNRFIVISATSSSQSLFCCLPHVNH